MALLNKDAFKAVEKGRNHVHEPVEATYTEFTKNGRQFFQIDTFGTSGREVPGKISQSVQLDMEMAKILISKLRKAFSLD